MNTKVHRIGPEDFTVGDPTPGMVRHQAVVTDGMWAGRVDTEPGIVSGWHHHGEYETAIYVVTGRLHMEAGPGGSEITDAEPGDFVYVPPRAIHREGNASDELGHLVVVRSGSGPQTINVDGPE